VINVQHVIPQSVCSFCALALYLFARQLDLLCISAQYDVCYLMQASSSWACSLGFLGPVCNAGLRSRSILQPIRSHQVKNSTFRFE
jgi:hypothetical protein